MRRTRLVAAALAAVVLAVSGCSDSGGDGTDAGPELSVDTATVRTQAGSVERPTAWKAIPGTGDEEHVASFSMRESGRVVGQMDVFVGKVAPGSPADVVSEGVQGQRALNFADLRSVRREFTDVPGAESAALDVNTYTTADGEPARSIEQLAIAPDGTTMTVRISTAQSAFDAGLFESLLATMELRQEESS